MAWSRRVRTIALSGVAVLLILALGGFIAIVLEKKRRTGKWSWPDGNDMVRIKRMIKGKGGTPKIIYLHRGKLTLHPGDDDSSRNRSSLVRANKNEPVDLPGFGGSDALWRSIVACVKGRYSPFDVEVTDKRPKGDANYIMVAFARRGRQIGMKKDHRTGGLSPFNSKVIPRSIVLVFTEILHYRRTPTCETIVMEVAHSYGLDHSYSCKDVMSYNDSCGPRGFFNKNLRCGEGKPRDCADGNKTQNSYQWLTKLLGPHPNRKRNGKF